MVYDPSCTSCCLVAKSCVQLFETPLTAAHQTSLSLTIFQSLPKFMSIESMMLPNHLILCHSLLLLPSIFPSIRIFSNQSVVCIRWPKYWSFNFSISPSNEHSGFISFRLILHMHVEFSLLIFCLEFLYLYSSEILAYNYFFDSIFVWFEYQVMLALLNEFESVSFSSNFLEWLEKD